MNDKWTILHGDALKLLGDFSPGAFDAVITLRLRRPDPGREKQIYHQEVFQYGRRRAPALRGGCQGPAVLDPLDGGVAGGRPEAV